MISQYPVKIMNTVIPRLSHNTTLPFSELKRFVNIAHNTSGTNGIMRNAPTNSTDVIEVWANALKIASTGAKSVKIISTRRWFKC